MATTSFLVRVRHAALLAGLTAGLTACPTSRPNARCTLTAPVVSTLPSYPPSSQALGMPPQLLLMSETPFAKAVPIGVAKPYPVFCNSDDPNGPAAARPPSPIDDLAAISAGGGTSSSGEQVVCPAFPGKAEPEKAANSIPPCGANACPNKQIKLVSGDVELHVLFYDDPSAGRKVSSGCYYRVYGMSLAWNGKGPQR